MVTNNNSLGHIIRNGALILEHILKNRETSKLKKIDLLIKQLNAIRADLIQLKKQEEDLVK